MGRVAGGVLVTLLALPLALSLTGCGTRVARRGGGAQRAAPATIRVQAAALGALDPDEAYRRAGFLTTSGPVSFVGSVRFLAGPADSLLAVVAVSLPSRSLTFTREGARYRAAYEVEFDLLRQVDATARSVGRFKARETVRVSHLRETTRDEESVIFQQFVVVPPGDYTAALAVRDLGSNRTGTAEVVLNAPRFVGSAHNTGVGDGSVLAGAPRDVGIATPIAVHAASPRTLRAVPPDLVVNARSTAVFGRDSVIRLYLEWYDVGTARAGSVPPLVRLSVRSDDGRELHADSVVASTWGAGGQIAAAMARVPVAKVGLGRLRVHAWRSGGADTVSAPVFVSASDDLAAVSFDEMLGYLRYFTSTERLRALRDTTPEARPAAWAALLHATDPSPTTPEHEWLREYFNRLAAANARFRGEEVPGWLSDRGMVYTTLGEPDRVVEPRAGEVRERTQFWEYSQHRLRLAFVEQDGARRWRLTPASEAEFRAVAERVRAGSG